MFDVLRRAPKDLLKRGLRLALRSAPDAGIPPQYFGLTADARGSLELGGHALPQLTERYGSPLHVVSGARLRENARRFVATASEPGPPCEVFYSYKTNPVPGVLTELHGAGVGAEVISHYELWLALKLGVPPERIVYNGPAKSEASIRQAIELDIGLLNVNHREELDVVSRIAGELGRRPRIGVRATLGGWAGQFGTPAEGGQAQRVFEAALQSPNLRVVGLHVHRGGMIRAAADALWFVGEVLAFADELHARLGLKLEILDLGGSLGSRSVRGLGPRELRFNRTFFRELEAPDPEAALDIETYVRLLRQRVAEHYAARSEQAPRLFLEPGRALTSDAQLLLTRVLSIKSEGERAYAIMDAGINLAESCRSEYHQVLAARSHAEPLQIYTLVGPICTPGDTLRWALQLPKLTPGDTLAIMDAGAYLVPFATSFSFPRPAIVMVQGGQVTPLRRAETFDDLVSYDADVSARHADGWESRAP